MSHVASEPRAALRPGRQGRRAPNLSDGRERHYQLALKSRLVRSRCVPLFGAIREFARVCFEGTVFASLYSSQNRRIDLYPNKSKLYLTFL